MTPAAPCWRRAPSTDAVPSSYSGLLPVLIVLGAAVRRRARRGVPAGASRWAAQTGVALVGLIAALVAVVVVAGTTELTANGAIAIDGPALFLQGTLLCSALMSTLLLAERVGGRRRRRVRGPGRGGRRQLAGPPAARPRPGSQTELFPLATFALAGMMVFPAANNLLVMFVALEVLSLPLYLLCGLARRRRLLSQEAAVKYFLLGAFASAFFLYGLALLYGYAGSVDLPQILRATATSENSDILLFLGLALLLVGLLFKAGVGAVPRLDAGRLPGRPDAGDRPDGVLHEGRRVRRDHAGAATSGSPRPAGTGGR